MNTESVFETTFWSLLALMFLMRSGLDTAYGERASGFCLSAVRFNEKRCGHTSSEVCSFFRLPRSFCTSSRR